MRASRSEDIPWASGMFFETSLASRDGTIRTKKIKRDSKNLNGLMLFFM